MRTALALPLLAATVLALAGCAPSVQNPAPAPLPTQTGIEGEGSLPADPVNETVGINCQQLLNDQAVYDWGSGNFAYDAGYSPAAGNGAAEAVASGGLACRWVNLTSSETVDFAVSIPASVDDARSAAAAAGAPAPEIAPDAYFAWDGTTGHIEIISGQYWIIAESSWFETPGDATTLTTAALSALS
jgi:hypothetical protein